LDIDVNVQYIEVVLLHIVHKILFLVNLIYAVNKLADEETKIDI